MLESKHPKEQDSHEASLRRIAELEAMVTQLQQSIALVGAPLPAREALLAEVEKSVHLGSWFLNLKTNEVLWSEELFRILGMDPATETASVEKFFNALHPDDSQYAIRNMEILVQTHRLVPSELRIVWKDGTVREVITSGAVILGANGEVERVVGTVMDLTESRRADRERKQMESQLRQSQKMEVVGRMAAGVAHDFNNLLTIIAGNADLMLEEVKDERLRRIMDAAEVGATVTRQLLAFSRQTVVKLIPLDLKASVRDLVRLLGRLLGEDIQIRLDLGTEPAVILADPAQIQQILLNLAINARDAMPTGGELFFSADESFGPPSTEDPPGEGRGSSMSRRWVELSVKDTGKGMDANTRERAFEPFFTTKEIGKGTGLGLSTVQDIVSQFSGTIHIASQTGFGTKVTVRFPYHTEPMAKSVVVNEEAAQKGSESILLVEDNTDLRELIATFLASAGYRVLSVGRPSEAEALWNTEGETINLLVSDMVMPEKSGMELAKSLAGRKPGLRILLISGNAPSQNQLGDAAFLQKPFTRNELLIVVRKACDGMPTRFGPPKGIEARSKPRPKLSPFLFGPSSDSPQVQ